MPVSWPLIDWETMEVYFPGERYLDRLLKQIRKRQGEALMAAVRGVIAEERSGAWELMLGAPLDDAHFGDMRSRAGGAQDDIDVEIERGEHGEKPVR